MKGMSRKDLDEWILQMGVEMHRLSSEMSPAAPKLARQKEWAPRIDVFETAAHVLVKVELAGVRGGQFGIQYNGDRNSLIVRGERYDDTCDVNHQAAAHQLEIEYGQFARELNLPEVPLVIEDAQAQLSNGMLTIAIPKASHGDRDQVIVTRTITVRRLR